MQQWPRTRKIVTRIFAAACLLFLLTLAIVQIGQRVLRRRAERLIADLQQLHDGGTTWADMQRLMTRWGKYGHFDGVCTAQNCQYQIDLTDWIGEAAYPSSRRYALIPLVLFVLPAHWHDASLSTFLKFDDGNFTEWRTDFITYVPDRGALKAFSDEGYGLMASVTETDKPQSSILWQWPGSPPPRQYSIEPHINCTGCIGIRIHLASSTPPNMVHRLTDFNLDCITRWSPCAVAADMAPVAWHESEEEQKLRDASDKKADACGFSLEEMTRASDVILRVSIVGRGLGPLYPGGRDTPFYSARLLETIHGVSDWKPGTILRVEIESQKPEQVSSGKLAMELILLHAASIQGDDTVYVPHCGAIPATTETLSRVREAALNIPPAPPNLQ